MQYKFYSPSPKKYRFALPCWGKRTQNLALSCPAGAATPRAVEACQRPSAAIARAAAEGRCATPSSVLQHGGVRSAATRAPFAAVDPTQSAPALERKILRVVVEWRSLAAEDLKVYRKALEDLKSRRLTLNKRKTN